jgi:SAM-dependent methyltransferase
MQQGTFSSIDQSHAHSLQTLNVLREYDDFIESVGTMADMGCGHGQDLEWWATLTSRDTTPRPLNIHCTGVDVLPELAMAQQHRNMVYQNQNFEDPILLHKRRFDLIWCHDAFQYVINPIQTLRQWRDTMNPNGMLAIVVAQTTNIEYNRQAFGQRDFVYHHWTLVNLIHVLAQSGFDCKSGYFLKEPTDPWIHAVVYRDEQPLTDPRTTSWWQLADRGLLPESVVNSIRSRGQVQQSDLELPWLDRSLRSMAYY